MNVGCNGSPILSASFVYSDSLLFVHLLIIQCHLYRLSTSCSSSFELFFEYGIYTSAIPFKCGQNVPMSRLCIPLTVRFSFTSLLECLCVCPPQVASSFVYFQGHNFLAVCLLSRFLCHVVVLIIATLWPNIHCTTNAESWLPWPVGIIDAVRDIFSRYQK